MKESGQERKEKKNRYREFTASFAGLPLSVILFWLAVKQPFSDVGILLCLLFLTGAAVSFLTAVINGIIAFIRLKKKFPEKIPQQKLPEAGQRERMPALSMALVITGCIFAGTCLPLFAAHIFSADDFPLLVLLMFMSGSAAAVTAAGTGTARTLIRKKQAGSRPVMTGAGLIFACGGIFLLTKSLSGYSPFHSDLTELISFAAGIALAAAGISVKKTRN